MVSHSASMLVQESNHTKLCAFCNSNLDVEEGVMIYDKKWYHNLCWETFGNKKEVLKND
jgi:galactose-1-phosphate uridylyltransferase